jgi:hypothetical protein
VVLHIRLGFARRAIKEDKFNEKVGHLRYRGIEPVGANYHSPSPLLEETKERLMPVMKQAKRRVSYRLEADEGTRDLYKEARFVLQCSL